MLVLPLTGGIYGWLASLIPNGAGYRGAQLARIIDTNINVMDARRGVLSAAARSGTYCDLVRRRAVSAVAGRVVDIDDAVARHARGASGINLPLRLEVRN